MTTPINRELQELRMVKEHYINVLKYDKNLKENGNPENHRLLKEKDIDRINLKIDGISEKINELLVVEKDYIN